MPDKPRKTMQINRPKRNLPTIDKRNLRNPSNLYHPTMRGMHGRMMKTPFYPITVFPYRISSHTQNRNTFSSARDPGHTNKCWMSLPENSQHKDGVGTQKWPTEITTQSRRCTSSMNTSKSSLPHTRRTSAPTNSLNFLPSNRYHPFLITFPLFDT